jgi:hypothetical protein
MFFSGLIKNKVSLKAVQIVAAFFEEVIFFEFMKSLLMFLVHPDSRSNNMVNIIIRIDLFLFLKNCRRESPRQSDIYSLIFTEVKLFYR